MASQHNSQLPFHSSRQGKQYALNDVLVPIGKQKIMIGNLNLGTGNFAKKRKNFSTKISPRKYNEILTVNANYKPIKMNKTML